jgi:malate synthase
VYSQQYFQNFLSGSGNAGTRSKNGHHTRIIEEIFVYDIFISLISNWIHHGTKNKIGIQPTVKVDPSAA